MPVLVFLRLYFACMTHCYVVAISTFQYNGCLSKNDIYIVENVSTCIFRYDFY